MYRRVQNGAAVALPDGKPLSVYSRKHGFPEAERVTGPDLMGELFARDNGLRHYFYGGSPETIAVLETKLKEKYPKLRLQGWYLRLTARSKQRRMRLRFARSMRRSLTLSWSTWRTQAGKLDVLRVGKGKRCNDRCRRRI